MMGHDEVLVRETHRVVHLIDGVKTSQDDEVMVLFGNDGIDGAHDTADRDDLDHLSIKKKAAAAVLSPVDDRTLMFKMHSLLQQVDRSRTALHLASFSRMLDQDPVCARRMFELMQDLAMKGRLMACRELIDQTGSRM